MKFFSESALLEPKRLVWPTSWVGHIPFAAWLISEFKPRQFVELGTHTGNSYSAFCQAIVDHRVDTKAFAVDTWRGDAHAGEYDDTIYLDLQRYHDPLYAHFSKMLRMTFDHALDQFQDGSVDLLHIDGLHTYDAVRHDFMTWLPKMSSRGVVLFHDTHVHRDDFGVHKLWAELSAQYPAFSFSHSNGLGVLLVGSQVDRSMQDLAQSMGADLDRSPARRFFEFLGNRLEQSAQISEMTRAAVGMAQQISDLQQLVAHRDRDVAELKAGIAAYEERNTALAEGNTALAEDLVVERVRFESALLELRALDQQIYDIRHTISWRVTAPLRLLRMLMDGRFREASRLLRSRMPSSFRKVAYLWRSYIERLRSKVLSLSQISFDENSNRRAIDAIVYERQRFTERMLATRQLDLSSSAQQPRVDISVVTHNNQRWIDSFVASLIESDYPKELVSLCFVDNQSMDATVEAINHCIPRLTQAGYTARLIEQSNNGFGGGHNRGLRGGTAPFCLVTNVDLTFEPSSISKIIARAQCDASAAVAWELRQQPYEHPKFYDPVTGSTNWNSHACVLLRREAFDKVGGYDETLFMYGEDVELSYRLRRSGGLLRYCPEAVVLHYSYEFAGQVKPLQYTGSTFANLYLRLKYGSLKSIFMAPIMGLALLLVPPPFPGARRAVAKNLVRLTMVAPKALMGRRNSKAWFPFRAWDYEMIRDGAFVAGDAPPPDCPLVSVITRTYRGRDRFLHQAAVSVLRQTYPHIEYIVIEDGGETLRPVIANLELHFQTKINYIPLAKLGRSAAGNAGLQAATGRWCVFLDDDDLFFCDHIECLVNALTVETDAVAAYSLAWDITTAYPQEPGDDYHETSWVVPRALRGAFDPVALRRQNCMAIQSVLFERQLFLQRGGFETDLDALEDWVLWNIYAHRNTFIHVPKVTSVFRTPADARLRAARNEVFANAYEATVGRIEKKLAELDSMLALCPAPMATSV